MGSDLLRVDRRSRIHLQGRFIDYPIRLTQATRAFGAGNAVRGALSYLGALATNHRQDGGHLRGLGHAPVWPRALRDLLQALHGEGVGHPLRPTVGRLGGAADQRAQPRRDRARRGLPPTNPAPTAVRQFYYPRLGYGTISDRLADGIAAERQEVLTSTSLATLHFSDGDAAVDVVDDAGAARTIRCGQVISTVPLDALLDGARPRARHRRGGGRAPASPTAASSSSFSASRSRRCRRTPGRTFPSPDLLFGRSHEPKNWSAAMVPGASVTSLALEVFSSPGEPTWDSRRRGPRRARGRRTRRPSAGSGAAT